MNSSWFRHTLNLLLVLGIASSWSCGDKPPEEKKKEEKKKTAAAAPASKKDKTFTPVAKPEWDAVMPHFMAHLEGLRSDLGGPMAGANIRDIFLDLTPKGPEDDAPVGKATKLGVKPVNHGAKKAENKPKAQNDIDSILKAINSPGSKPATGPGKPGDLVPKDPLTAFPLNRYLVRIVMTGVANPEAFIEAPDGKMHVIHRGDRLGVEGGLVVDVLKAKVLFRLPEREELVEVVMAPEITPTLLEGVNIKGVAGDKKTP